MELNRRIDVDALDDDDETAGTIANEQEQESQFGSRSQAVRSLLSRYSIVSNTLVVILKVLFER